ncbi:MAG: 5-oxoprolinase subunit PxpB [Thermomicrobiales bacterium]
MRAEGGKAGGRPEGRSGAASRFLAASPPRRLAVLPLAESALLVRVSEEERIEPDVVAEAAALARAMEEAAPAGLLDVVPAYTTVLVSFDPRQIDAAEMAATIRRAAETMAADPAADARLVTFPVVYGGEHGPDLMDVAAHTGLSAEEVVARHTEADYLVACIGFSPGFPYLLGLPSGLTTPRLANPRMRVPAGSVGIGGQQTAVYPQATPGGWRLIGRTPLVLFDPARAEPFLLRAGDRVRFEAWSSPHPPAPSPSVQRERGSASVHRRPRTTIRVREAGLLTTVQDLGRPGLMRFGVAPGGVLDRAALILGNRLVGNDPDAAGLEITLVGPVLEFAGEAVVAITGGDLGARLNGATMPRWRPVAVRAGDTLSFKPGGRGARAYLCVAGGIAVEPVLGSRSTDLAGGFGGVEGRALVAGDVVPLGEPSAPLARLLRRRLAVALPDQDRALTARVVLGPQTDRFTPDGVAAFLGNRYVVSGKADRTGIRLAGPAIGHSRGADLLSEGITHGAVQVPGDGQPIVLLAARQTIGGYPKIATVIGADLDRLGQARPGDTIRFVEVTAEEARAATLAYWAGLIDEGGGGGAVIGWDPDGVVRVIEALRAADVSAFRIEVEGLTLDVQRGAGGELVVQGAMAEVVSAPLPTPVEITATAPVLGAFYRRRSPEEPPLVEVGQAVEAGQALGLIEVMKTYHEVAAPDAGVVTAFLVDDGEFVEYGQALATIARSEE